MTGEIEIRRARDSDRDAMLEITRGIWDGTDYVPDVWERWIDDANGVVQIASLDGRVVGLQHAYIQVDGSCWLEGIRVAAEMQRRGVARALLEAGICWATANGCEVVRMSTSGSNPASTRLAEKAGMRLVATFVPLEASPLEAAPQESMTEVARAMDLAEVQSFLEELQRSGYPTDFYGEGWTFHRLSAARLQLLLATHDIALVRGPEIEGLAIATVSPPFTGLRIGFLGGSSDAVSRLCTWLRYRAFQAGIHQVSATVLRHTALLEAAGKAGFRAPFDFELRLYELDLTAAAQR
jgi:GNAT superfamily N-acetyltransferase